MIPSARVASTVVRAVALSALLAATLCGCTYRSEHYDSVEEARANNLFEKGWLPDVLPASAHDLNMFTAVETSSGYGRFRLDPKDYRAFSARLSAADGPMPDSDRDRKAARKLLDEGYEARRYASVSTRWLFLCNANGAVCEFFVWQ